MSSGPDDLDYYVDIPDVDDLFNVPWRTRILTDRSGRGYRRWGQIPQPVYLIGRPITSSTQTPDSIVDINGRLKVTGGFGNSAAIATGSILSGTEPIGDLFFLRKVAAGNVSCLSNTTLLGVGVAIYQLLQANYYIATDSTVATRTPANPKINTAFNASAV